MQKWLKYVNKLKIKEQFRLLEIIGLIKNERVDGLDIRKIEGQKNLYRVRVGRHRIIFDGISHEILSVGKREGNTYNF